MDIRKTDIEIAADAIKYCKKELEKYNYLIDKYNNEKEGFLKTPSEETYLTWVFEKERLEKVLGMRDTISTIPWKTPDHIWYNKRLYLV